MYFMLCYLLLWASLVVQSVKRLPAVWETRVQPLGQEDPLEKEMATYSSILTGESHGAGSLVGYSAWSYKESDTRAVFLFCFLNKSLKALSASFSHWC